MLKLIKPKVTSSLPPIPKVLPLAQRFVRVEISCQIDTVIHDKGDQVSTNAPALMIVQLQRPGYHLDNAFYEELKTKAISHLRKHLPLQEKKKTKILNVSTGYTVTFDPETRIKYCAQPGRSLHKVWLPLNSKSRQDAPDPATVKINHPNPTGHTFYLQTYLHIKQDVTPEPPAKSGGPPAPPAAPQPPPTPATGEQSPMAAAMENLRAIANDCDNSGSHNYGETLKTVIQFYARC
jgi:hypothetical protein